VRFRHSKHPWCARSLYRGLRWSHRWDSHARYVSNVPLGIPFKQTTVRSTSKIRWVEVRLSKFLLYIVADNTTAEELWLLEFGPWHWTYVFSRGVMFVAMNLLAKHPLCFVKPAYHNSTFHRLRIYILSTMISIFIGWMMANSILSTLSTSSRDWSWNLTISSDSGTTYFAMIGCSIPWPGSNCILVKIALYPKSPPVNIGTSVD